MSPIFYFAPFAFIAAALYCLLLPSAFLFLLIAALPLLFLGFDAFSIAGDGPAPQQRSLYRCVPSLYVPLQLTLILLGSIQAETVSAFRFFGLVLAIGLTSGIFGVLAAHELVHSRRQTEQTLGQMFFAVIAYPHFAVAHLKGHHRQAATRADPATARRGESFYWFIVRSVIGQATFAFKVERTQFCRNNRSWRSSSIRYAVATLMVYCACLLFIGLQSTAFLVLQSLLAISVLELFNYIAHYGLLRDIRADGRPVPMSTHFSWNTRRLFSNIALLNGGRHSDHHRSPAGEYQNLRSIKEAPELRFGYGGTMLLALVPPLWRAITHPILDALENSAPPMPGRQTPRNQHEDCRPSG